MKLFSNHKRVIVFPGQKIIATDGKVHTVAFVNCGQVYGFGLNGLPEPITVVGDAFGGEFDQLLGLAA